MAYRDNNNIPILPGAYMINYGTGYGATNNVVIGFPIYGSIYSYASFFQSGSSDDWYMVLPGYKLVVYTQVGYGGTSYTLDNTSGTTITEYPTNVTGRSSNTGNSCKLYYDNIELSNVYDPSGNIYSGTNP